MALSSVLTRLEKLEKKVRPDESLSARFDRMCEPDREIYSDWQSECDLWRRRFSSDVDAYAALVNGDGPPDMPKRIAEQLHGSAEETDIYDTDTLEQAAEKYRRML